MPALLIAVSALAGCSVTDASMTSALDLSLPQTVTAPSFADGERTETSGSIAAIGYAAPGPGEAAAPGEVDRLIAKYAAIYEVPEDLVRRVARRESTFNPNAYNRGHWGLMQIKHQTARGMGYRGPARGLLDAETNLKYAVKYLRGAWMVADGNAALADRLYQRGYYYDAKRKGLLKETGLRN